MIECRATVEQCRKCLSLETPGDVNAMTVGVACLSLMQGGFRRSAGCVAQCYYAFIPKAQRPASPPDGAGTELERIIATWFGISDDPKCKCKSRVAEMNARGVAWCEASIETIVGWLKEEAARRQFFFSKPVARQVVRLAIRRAKAKSKKPGWNGVP